MKLGQVDADQSELQRRWDKIASDAFACLPKAAQERLSQSPKDKRLVLEQFASIGFSEALIVSRVPSALGLSDIIKEMKRDIEAAKRCERVFEAAVEELRQVIENATPDEHHLAELIKRVENCEIARRETIAQALALREQLVSDHWNNIAQAKDIIITPDEKIEIAGDQTHLFVCSKNDRDPGFDGPLISVLRRGPRKHKPHLLRFVSLLIKEYVRIGQPSESELTTPDVVSDRREGNLCCFVFTFVDEIDDLRSDSDDALNNLSKNYVRRALNDLREDKAKAIRNFEGEEEVEDSTNLEENPNWPTFQYASSFLNLEVRRREGWRSSLLGITPPSFKTEKIPKHRRPGENGLQLPIETNSTEEVSTWTRWRNGLSRLMSSAVVTALVARFSIRK